MKPTTDQQPDLQQRRRDGRPAPAPISRETTVRRDRSVPGNDRLFPRCWNSTYHHLRVLRRTLEEIIATWVAGRGYSVLVDYGCGAMPYRPLFAPHIDEYQGADLADNPHAHRTLRADGGLPHPDASVQIVLSTQVLEHVTDPGLYLQECRRVLADDGLLILSTHGTWRYHPCPTDYWRWTNAGLRRVVEEASFEVVDFHGGMGLAATGLQLFQDAVSPAFPWGPRQAFRFGMQLLMALADRCTRRESRDRDGDVFIVVARPAARVAQSSGA